ncbi:MAG: UbiD family decarboxylase [Chloroflexi bacterium]|nr:UbiD family decarboxylase [Chloroflexota bacterium]
MAFADLRQFLNYLEDQGQLQTVAEETDPKYEVARRLNRATRSHGPALLFRQVQGSDMPLVGGIFGTRERVLMAMECTEQNVTQRVLDGIAQLIPPRLVASGPCQDVVLTGEQIDLTRLPIPTFSPKDGGPYITAGVFFCKDLETGTRNVSIIRHQLKGKRRLGTDLHDFSHTGIHYGKAEARGRALEVAIAIGCDPVVSVVSQWFAPYGVDELGLAGALRGEPVELVKCKTVDVEVPASAEIVIEGRVPLDVREEEGPFGEFTGYYTPASPKPVVEVTAVTYRRDPIYQAVLCGLPTTEVHLIGQLLREAAFLEDLKSQFPGVRAVHRPTVKTLFISLRQRSAQEARNVLAAALSMRDVKVAVVVDDDINAFDMEQVMWAVATRSQPDDDFVVLRGMMSTGLDPSCGGGATAKVGIDATRPFGQPFPDMARLPE